MSSTNKTPLGFNQWIGTDQPLREDFNADNLLTDTQLQKKVEAGGTVQASYLFAKRMQYGPTTASNPTPWYKIASIAPTAISTDLSAVFHVYESYASQVGNGIRSGILKISFRVSGSLPAGTRNSYIGWEYVSGFDPNNFVLAYSPTTENAVAELWAKETAQYNFPIFEMMTEGSRENRNSNLWTVYNNPTGAAEIPAGRLQKVSEVMPLIGPSTIQSAITYTVDIADLQKTIDSLPRYLNRAVTIYANPGEISSVITVSNFISAPLLTIRGGTGTNPSTHKVGGFIVSDNIAPTIHVYGFSATNTAGNSFYINRNAGYTYFYGCSSLEGVNTTSGLIGFNHNEGAGIVYISTCTVSNKNQAIRQGMARSATSTLSGTGNSIAFRAEYGGDIRIRVLGTITADTMYSVASAGTIVQPTST